MGILRKSFMIWFVVATLQCPIMGLISKVLSYFLLPPVPGLLLLEQMRPLHSMWHFPHDPLYTALLSSFESVIPCRVLFSMSESDATMYISQ